jgi:hypothetical protein
MLYRDYILHGIPVFPLWPIVNGGCACGIEGCPAAGKHPRANAWQHTPLYSDEQVTFLEDSDQLDGWGALVSSGLLVIDVDARNGGVASWDRLCAAYPHLHDASRYIVETGSGGGSRHVYFRQEGTPVALRQTHEDYPGIDFKSSGYVVGPGSPHTSGGSYRVIYGDPCDIIEPPAELVALLRKPETHRSSVDGRPVDVTDSEIDQMLAHIDANCGYEKWIRCGMAIHQATAGTGLAKWDAWSQTGKSKYPGKAALSRHWHSFGKSANPVSIGTLAHYASEGGWLMPVTFAPDAVTWSDDEDTSIDISQVDILRPPGFVGEISAWINARCLYPREHLAVAGALYAVSCIAGMRHRDTQDAATGNLFAFGVAGSATGKESILKAVGELLISSGIASAVHGGIKSEQEIIRNLIQHQAAFYLIDEMGEVLNKLQSARKSSGGAAYLQGVIGQLMAIYTKADSIVPVTGDIGRQLKQELLAARSSLKDDATEEQLADINRRLEAADMGLVAPYLCMFGLTTPGLFDELMTFDMAASGFLGRALVFREIDDNPRAKKRGAKRAGPVSDQMMMALRRMYQGGTFSESSTVCRQGEQQAVETTEAGLALMDTIQEAFWQMADAHSETSGLTAIPRRGYELVAKVSLILAIPSGLRTVEHIRWAYALVRRDIEAKIRMVLSNSNKPSDAIRARVEELLKDGPMTLGRIHNRCIKWPATEVTGVLEAMKNHGLVICETVPASRGAGRTTTKWSKK